MQNDKKEENQWILIPCGLTTQARCGSDKIIHTISVSELFSQELDLA